MAKRIRFLRVVKSQLELANVDLLEQDFGAAATPKCFDTAVARAVAPAGKLWPMLEPALNPGGRVVVFSSTQMETADPVAVGAGEDITYHYRTERVAVPGSDQPHVVEVLERP
jgi:16S rRNA G527 N7-methylase RsmG